MTLEEKAEQFLTEKNIHDSVIWDKYEGKGWDLSILLEEFARQVAKAKLEEAADRAEVKYVEYKTGNKTWNIKAVVDKESITKTPLD